MAEMFTSGRVVDLLLAVVAIEVVIILLLRRLFRKDIAMSGILAAMLPGVLLLLALRAALLQTHWVWIASFLLLAFAAHLADLRVRWACAPSANVNND